MIGWLIAVFLLLAIGAIGYPIYQSAKPPQGSVAQFLKRSRPAGKRVAVVFGASTIHGRVGIDALPAVRDRLPGWEIVNGGHNGDTCLKLLARVEPVLACKPDAIVVQAGGNDALGDRSTADFEGDLTALVERLQASGANLGLCSFQVAGDDLATRLNRLLGDYAQIVRGLAARRKLGYLPLRERMTADLEAHPGGRAWDRNFSIMLSSMFERHLLRRSVDEQSRRRGFRFNADGLHLNTRGSGLLSDVIVEYLETVDRTS
ncbi:MAG TPA: SGNH/GDSL hydrolase family protein [Candidatus Dormibacteraeota bacterium]